MSDNVFLFKRPAPVPESVKYQRAMVTQALQPSVEEVFRRADEMKARGFVLSEAERERDELLFNLLRKALGEGAPVAQPGGGA